MIINVKIIKHARGSWSPSDPEPTFTEVKIFLVKHRNFLDFKLFSLWFGWLRRIWKSGTSTGCRSALDAGNHKQSWAVLKIPKFFSRVCQLPFRYVIKYENLAEEWPHLLHRWSHLQTHQIDLCPPSLGVSEDERTALQLPWENRGPEGAGSLKAGYLDKLPEETMLKLFNKVAADFTMFGYTIQDQY